MPMELSEGAKKNGIKEAGISKQEYYSTKKGTGLRVATVVGVRFKRAGKIYYFDPGGFELKVADKVIVETARGVEFGEVVIAPRDVAEDDLVLPLKTVIRLGTEEDIKRVEDNLVKQKEAYEI